MTRNQFVKKACVASKNEVLKLAKRQSTPLTPEILLEVGTNLLVYMVDLVRHLFKPSPELMESYKEAVMQSVQRMLYPESE